MALPWPRGGTGSTSKVVEKGMCVPLFPRTYVYENPLSLACEQPVIIIIMLIFLCCTIYLEPATPRASSPLASSRTPSSLRGEPGDEASSPRAPLLTQGEQ